MPSQEEIYVRVSAVLSDMLCAEKEEITPESVLFRDLGASSIDLLAIVFRLEREFKIKIPRNELFPESIFHNDPEFMHLDASQQYYIVNEKGLALLREKMPFADITEFEKNPIMTNIADLFTVDMLVKYVQSKLETKAT